MATGALPPSPVRWPGPLLFHSRGGPFVDPARIRKMTGIELYALIFFSILIVTLALMFGAGLLFWTHYPRDLRSSAE